MTEINWQDAFKDNSLEDEFRRKTIPNHLKSDSFAAQFTGMDPRFKNDIGNENNHHFTYGDGYRNTAQDRREIIGSDDGFHHGIHPSEQLKNRKGYQQKGYTSQETIRPENSPIVEQEPNFQYAAMNKGDNNLSSSWEFFDLRNKKQTGDLYKKILFFQKKHSFKIFNFIGSRGREGVSTVLANLVDYVNSQTTEKNFLVIDANLSRPNLDKIFNISRNTLGLMDVFDNRIGIREAITPISSKISFLCCGKGDSEISANIEQENILKLLDYCRQSYDYIFIDCPPVLSSPDSLSIAPAADITFLVLQSAKDQKPVVDKVKTLLQNDECKIGGVVLNRMQQVIPGWLYKLI